MFDEVSFYKGTYDVVLRFLPLQEFKWFSFLLSQELTDEKLIQMDGLFLFRNNSNVY